MRGLTEAEYAELRELNSEGPDPEPEDFTEGVRALYGAMKRDGRVKVDEIYDLDDEYECVSWGITKLGQLAVKLWPATRHTEAAR